MKRIIVLVIGILMLLSTVAYATEIDWDSMTLDEILDLRDEATKQIDARLAEHENGYIYEGIYVFGNDIEVGLYLIKQAGDESLYIKVYDDYHDLRLSLEKIYRCIRNDDPFYYLNAEEGVVLEVMSGVGQLIPWTKPSWAP